MDFLKNNRCFDFLYGGTSFSDLSYKAEQTEGDNELTTVYSFADGLRITNIASKHGDAYEWVNRFELFIHHKVLLINRGASYVEISDS